MGLLDTVKDMLAQYSGGASPADAASDFHKLAESADAGTLAHGIAEVMRSDQTPPFAEIISQLFANGSSEQQAAMVKALIGAVPAEQQGQLAAMLGGTGTGTGAGSSGAPGVPSNDMIAALARRAEQGNPGIIDAMSAFYAQHPTLVKTLGSAALMIAMQKIAQHHRNA